LTKEYYDFLMELAADALVQLVMRRMKEGKLLSPPADGPERADKTGPQESAP
jgi:hypothetical protein